MRMSSSDGNVAPPWPPPCSPPCPSPPLETTADDCLASLLCRIDELNAPKCLLQPFWEHYHQFLLSSVLRELWLTTHCTTPVLIKTALPPPTRAKYVFATSYLFIQEGQGPVLLSPVMFSHCAPSLPGQQ
eukprot:3017430-Ditylum_brightwellii.AAC.1